MASAKALRWELGNLSRVLGARGSMANEPRALAGSMSCRAWKPGSLDEVRVSLEESWEPLRVSSRAVWRGGLFKSLTKDHLGTKQRDP
jgi:hypothetical protein